jgi:hypothetical protein
MKRKDIEKEMLAALITNERARKPKEQVRRARKTRKLLRHDVIHDIIIVLKE